MRGSKVPFGFRNKLIEYIGGKVRRGEYGKFRFTEADVAALSIDTRLPPAEVERAFFALAGDVWRGHLMPKGEGDDIWVNRPLSEWQDYLAISFDAAWMQSKGTMPRDVSPT